MKMSDALRICSDFAPVKQEDGKVKCRHLQVDDMCKLPSHFCCELVMYKKKPPQYTSVSRTQIWQKCERAYAFQYYWKVEPMKPSPWKAVGQAFALCRAKIDEGQPWEVPNDLPDITDKWKLEWILGEYARLPKIEGTNEQRVECLIAGGPPEVYVMGYLDKLSKDRKKIYEWKYTVDGDNYDIQAVRLQCSAYFGAVPEAEEVVICLAKKSKLERQLKTPPEKIQYTKGKGEKKCGECWGTGKRKWLPTACKVCGQPQYSTQSGDTCGDHGGADGIKVGDDIKLPEMDCTFCKGKGKTWTEEPRLYAGLRLEDETEAEFKQRLKEKHPNPFEFKTFLRGEFDIEGDRELMRRQYLRQEDAKLFKVFDPNFSNCGDCDFRDVCKSHPAGPGCDDPTCPTPGACHLVKIREARKSPQLPKAPEAVPIVEEEGI